MNAEFLEQKIIFNDDTNKIVSPTTVRKGMTPASFIGAEVIIVNNAGATVGAEIIAKTNIVSGKVRFVVETQNVDYDPETGTIGSASDGSGV